MPPGAKYVGRPSRWGNPDRVGVDGDAAECVAKYRAGLERFRAEYPFRFAAWLAPLRGHDLACWCPLTDDDGHPTPCHADELLRMIAELWPQDAP
jgi:hypothetical protein